MLSESCDVPQKEAMTLHNLCTKDMAQWCQLTLPPDGFPTSHKHVRITANNSFNLLHPSVISNFYTLTVLIHTTQQLETPASIASTAGFSNITHG